MDAVLLLVDLESNFPLAVGSYCNCTPINVVDAVSQTFLPPYN